jgi:uncharacterized hydrophobic protein (TIGR00271 family)
MTQPKKSESDKRREQTPVPDHAKTILVPIANPDSAHALLSLAGSLADSTEGRVIALAVVIGDDSVEEQKEALEKLEQIVAGIPDVSGTKVEMATRSAPTVARGILDAGSEMGADMILVGVHQSRKGDVSLGPVVESVMSTSSADVLVVRIPHKTSGPFNGIKRVLVAVDGSDESRTGVRVGLLIAESMGAAVQALHVQGSEVPRAIGLATIERSLEGVNGSHVCGRELVVANDVSRGILARAEATDLIVLGVHVGKHLLQWRDTAVSAEVLRSAPGPVITVSRQVSGRTLAGILRRIRPKLTDIEQDAVIWQSERLAGLSVDFVLLSAISALLAAFGLLLNSPAVVIGAMLVAPLLGPLVAISVGLVTARLRLFSRALFTVFVGAASGVACGWLLGLIVPLESPTAEMLARGNPTLLDAGVALAAGAVGAYATARKEIPAALAGVAIAAALVPPLGTIGLGIALGNWSLALGATLLFLTNIVSVAVIGSGVFLWLGMRSEPGLRERRRALSLGLVGVLTLVTVIFVLQVVEDARIVVVAERNLASALQDAEVVSMEYQPGDPIRLLATVRTETTITPAQVAAIERGLEARFGAEVELSVVIESVVRAGP